MSENLEPNHVLAAAFSPAKRPFINQMNESQNTNASSAALAELTKIHESSLDSVGDAPDDPIESPIIVVVPLKQQLQPSIRKSNKRSSSALTTCASSLLRGDLPAMPIENNNLYSLKCPTDEDTVRALLNRWERKGLAFTWSGENTLVALAQTTRFATEDDVLAQVEAAYEVGHPSPESVAVRAIKRSLATSRNQVIVVSGFLGSGKTRCAERVTAGLVSKNVKLMRKLGAAQTLLFAFGGSCSERSEDSSKFAQWTEVYHDGQTALGAKIVPFGLDTSLIGDSTTSFRLFNLIHQCLAFDSEEHEPEGLWSFNGDDAWVGSGFRLVAESQIPMCQASSTNRTFGKDLDGFDAWLKACSDLELSIQDQDFLTRTISAVLFLGGLVTETTLDRLQTSLKLAAEALQVDFTDLQEALGACDSFERTLHIRMQMARDLYASAFAWLARRVNLILAVPATTSMADLVTIGVLDAFGFDAPLTLSGSNHSRSEYAFANNWACEYSIGVMSKGELQVSLDFSSKTVNHFNKVVPVMYTKSIFPHETATPCWSVMLQTLYSSFYPGSFSLAEFTQEVEEYARLIAASPDKQWIQCIARTDRRAGGKRNSRAPSTPEEASGILTQIVCLGVANDVRANSSKFALQSKAAGRIQTIVRRFQARDRLRDFVSFVNEIYQAKTCYSSSAEDFEPMYDLISRVSAFTKKHRHVVWIQERLPSFTSALDDIIGRWQKVKQVRQKCDCIIAADIVSVSEVNACLGDVEEFCKNGNNESILEALNMKLQDAKLAELVVECKSALSMNPHNQFAFTKVKRLAQTVTIPADNVKLIEDLARVQECLDIAKNPVVSTIIARVSAMIPIVPVIATTEEQREKMNMGRAMLAEKPMGFRLNPEMELQDHINRETKNALVFLKNNDMIRNAALEKYIGLRSSVEFQDKTVGRIASKFVHRASAALLNAASVVNVSGSVRLASTSSTSSLLPMSSPKLLEPSPLPMLPTSLTSLSSSALVKQAQEGFKTIHRYMVYRRTESVSDEGLMETIFTPAQSSGDLQIEFLVQVMKQLNCVTYVNANGDLSSQPPNFDYTRANRGFELFGMLIKFRPVPAFFSPVVMSWIATTLGLERATIFIEHMLEQMILYSDKGKELRLKLPMKTRFSCLDDLRRNFSNTISNRARLAGRVPRPPPQGRKEGNVINSGVESLKVTKFVPRPLSTKVCVPGEPEDDDLVYLTNAPQTREGSPIKLALVTDVANLAEDQPLYIGRDPDLSVWGIAHPECWDGIPTRVRPQLKPEEEEFLQTHVVAVALYDFKDEDGDDETYMPIRKDDKVWLAQIDPQKEWGFCICRDRSRSGWVPFKFLGYPGYQ